MALFRLHTVDWCPLLLLVYNACLPTSMRNRAQQIAAAIQTQTARTCRTSSADCGIRSGRSVIRGPGHASSVRHRVPILLRIARTQQQQNQTISLHRGSKNADAAEHFEPNQKKRPVGCSRLLHPSSALSPAH